MALNMHAHAGWLLYFLPGACWDIPQRPCDGISRQREQLIKTLLKKNNAKLY